MKNKKMFKYADFIVVYSSIYKDGSKGYQYYGKNLTFRNTVYNISNNVFDNLEINKYITFVNDNIVYLLNFPKTNNKVDSIRKIYNLIDSLKRNIIQFLDVNMYIGISGMESNINSIPKLFVQAKTAHEKNFFDNNKITIYTENINNNFKIDCNVSLQQLKEYLISDDETELVNYINSIFDNLKKIKKINLVKNTLGDFMSYGKILAEQLNLSDFTSKKIDRFNYSNINKFKKFDHMRQYVLDLYSEILHSKKHNNIHNYSYAVYKSIEFIKKNYKYNISLSDISEHAEISKSYLSVLFKQETGINFSTYLIQYRIEKAKKLLLETNYKMYEIAEMVGFLNPYYFSKVFKDITGYTCKQYKALKY